MSAHDDYLDPDRHLWPEEPPEDYMTGIETVFEFFEVEHEGLTEEQCKAACEKRIYKYTDCGAWIEFHDWGISLGSIVEGCDFGTATYPLYYSDKFTEKDIQDRIDAIEAEADALWEWANSPCDNEGNPSEDGCTTLAELGVDAPDVAAEYRHLGQGVSHTFGGFYHG